MPTFQPIAQRASPPLLSLSAILALSIALLASGCGGSRGSTGSTPPSTPSTTNEWTWMSGSNTLTLLANGFYSEPGVYGTLGVASSSNVPGGRAGAISWADGSGNLWLFGGNGYDSTATLGILNDLWEFSPTAKTWAWVSGSNTVKLMANGFYGEAGTYGTLGVASAANVPGARDGAVSWTDSSGNLWFFGGAGYDSTGALGDLNDLWKFSPTNKEWTWVSGSDTANASGVYGTQGVPAATNVPGARYLAVSWIDGSGNLWLFGGVGGPGNDLWEFNPTNDEWVWVSGSNTVGSNPGVYGTQGVASASNVPGLRGQAVSWIDAGGNLWLFGGGGHDSTGANVSLNDLWEFTPSTKEWTWVSGSSKGTASGVYGTLGVASAANVPGGRDAAVSWTDSSGNLWLSGGLGLDSNGASGYLNDLWEFIPTAKTWTWMGGADTVVANNTPSDSDQGQSGVYGTEGVPAATNVPGGRYFAVGWTDSSGNFWLFGGNGHDSAGTLGDLNDLWRYQP